MRISTTPIHITLNKLCILLCMTVMIAPALASPKTLFTANYTGKYKGIGVTTERKLSHLNNNQYQFTAKAKSFIASIEEQSYFSTSNAYILPRHYHYDRRILGRRTKETLQFDWPSQRAHYTRDDKPEKNTTHILSTGMLDPSLYQLRLQAAFHLGEDHLNFNFVKKRKIKNYQFKKLRDTHFTLNKTRYMAIEITRTNNKDNKKTLITLIPALDYVLAKISHTEEDGATYEMTLSGYSSNRQFLDAFFQQLAEQNTKKQRKDESKSGKNSPQIKNTP